MILFRTFCQHPQICSATSPSAVMVTGCTMPVAMGQARSTSRHFIHAGQGIYTPVCKVPNTTEEWVNLCPSDTTISSVAHLDAKLQMYSSIFVRPHCLLSYHTAWPQRDTTLVLVESQSLKVLPANVVVHTSVRMRLDPDITINGSCLRMGLCGPEGTL
jgi:hypothetical protein